MRFLCLLSTCATAFLVVEATLAADAKPNIVFILADDKYESMNGEALFLRECGSYPRERLEIKGAADWGRFGAIPGN